jgi:two-component system, NarL family, response regulator YdfI
VITVLVVARTALARAGLETLIREEKALSPIAMRPGISLGEQLDETRPDVLVLDVDQEPVSFAVRELSRLSRPPATIVLTADERLQWTTDAVRAGVRAVLPRQVAAHELVAAIEAVAAGLLVLHPDGAHAVRAPATVAFSSPTGVETLTAREIEVLGMMAEGLGNKLIAARLGLSGHTVKFHVASILGKLGAGSRTEAVTIGVRRGLIML